eukprot:scaffold12871_cov76-Phaeocystis_antarctica.AAC.11
MQHVELRIGQGVNQLLDVRERLVVARRVDHQATVLEARRVRDVPRRTRQRVAVGIEVEAHKLREGLECPQSTVDGLGVDLGLPARGRHLQSVRLVGVQLLVRLVLVGDHQVESRDLRARPGRATVGGVGEGVLVVALERLGEQVRRAADGEEVRARRHGEILLSPLDGLRERPERGGHLLASGNNHLQVRVERRWRSAATILVAARVVKRVVVLPALR